MKSPEKSSLEEWVNLADERLGASVIAANDEFFAPKENLLRASDPVFIEGKYTDRGKWMDGWETRRRRELGYDWCVIELGASGVVRELIVDTRFFRGNFPERCSIEACAVDGTPSATFLASPEVEWFLLLPETALAGDTLNRFTVDRPERVTHLRLNIFPDGGVARLRVFGEVVPDWRRLAPANARVDLAAIACGGRVVDCSDKFFGSPHNMLMPGRGVNMGDGWETKRRRGPGHDWAVLQLGVEGEIDAIEVDTNHFKGNAPESCLIEGALSQATPTNETWRAILPRTTLRAHALHHFDRELQRVGPVDRIRISIFPDGGVSRLRLFGVMTAAGRESAGVRQLNALTSTGVAGLLSACCGSRTWAARIAVLRPFRDLGALLKSLHETANAMSQSEWLEAFRSHPRIGETQPSSPASPGSDLARAALWSTREQAGAATASKDLKSQLAEANRAYEARFGFIFIVCATGKTAREILDTCQKRLSNTVDEELRNAANEQRAIAELRVRKWVTE